MEGEKGEIEGKDTKTVAEHDCLLLAGRGVEQEPDFTRQRMRRPVLVKSTSNCQKGGNKMRLQGAVYDFPCLHPTILGGLTPEIKSHQSRGLTRATVICKGKDQNKTADRRTKRSEISAKGSPAQQPRRSSTLVT